MSDAHEKALEVAAKVTHTMFCIDDCPRSAAMRPWVINANKIVSAYLAALPPSIVVDGKVVVVANGGFWAPWAMTAVHNVATTKDDGGIRLRRLFDAAREVADE